MNLFKDQIMISDRIAGQKKRNPIKKSDSKLFVCPKCRNVWEIIRKTNGTSRLVSYTHIPRYGKSKEVCRKCK